MSNIDFEIQVPKRVVTVDGIGKNEVERINEMIFNSSIERTDYKGYYQTNCLSLFMIDCVDKDFMIRITAKGSLCEEELINGRRNQKRNTKMRLFNKLRECKTKHIIVRNIVNYTDTCNEYVYDESNKVYQWVRYVFLNDDGTYNWDETYKYEDEFKKLCIASGVTFDNDWLVFLKLRYGID